MSQKELENLRRALAEACKERDDMQKLVGEQQEKHLANLRAAEEAQAEWKAKFTQAQQSYGKAQAELRAKYLAMKQELEATRQSQQPNKVSESRHMRRMGPQQMMRECCVGTRCCNAAAAYPPPFTGAETAH